MSIRAPLLPVVALLLAAPLAAADYAHDILPILEVKCLRCHGGEKVKGKIDLRRIDPAKPGERLDMWQDIIDAVDLGDMPPEDEPQLSDFERERILAFARGLEYQGERNPGHVTVRRMNRTEYDNTIRDLLGVDIAPAKGFPADDVGEGFDNIGEVLTIPPLLMEKYLTAADTVLDAAIVPGQVVLPYQPNELPFVVAGEEQSPPGGDGPRTLEEAGALVIYANFPVEGRWDLQVTAAAERVDKQPGALLVRMEGDNGPEFEKGVKVTAKPDKPRDYSISLGRTERGVKRIELRFFNPGEVDGAKRQLIIEKVLIEGPPVRRLPDSTEALVIARPGDELGHVEAARQVLAAFTRRAFRRPVEDAEVERYLGIYRAAAEAGHFYDAALKYALQAVLVSPHFLFRIERGGAADEAGHKALTDHELASRLSYFLWCSMPDQELFALADAGKLSDPETLRAQARRMIQDPKAAGLVDSFAEQWLQLRLLIEHVPNADDFPEYDETLRDSMIAEAKTFFHHIMTDDRPITELIAADYSFIDGRLAQHYGIDGVSGAVPQRVELDGERRGGVMTMAAVLTLTSHPERTSPSRRGKFVLEQIVGGAPPPPPAMVDSLPEDQPSAAGKSLRQLLEAHVSDPDCAACHKAIDPIGFSLEHYDAIGRWRERDDQGLPVNASAELPTGERLEGAAELRAVLTDARRDKFLRTFTRQLLTYALGRGLDSFDEPTVRACVDALRDDRQRFGALVEAIVTSYPFTHRGESR